MKLIFVVHVHVHEYSFYDSFPTELKCLSQPLVLRCSKYKRTGYAGIALYMHMGYVHSLDKSVRNIDC